MRRAPSSGPSAVTQSSDLHWVGTEVEGAVFWTGFPFCPDCSYAGRRFRRFLALLSQNGGYLVCFDGCGTHKGFLVVAPQNLLSGCISQHCLYVDARLEVSRRTMAEYLSRTGVGVELAGRCVARLGVVAASAAVAVATACLYCCGESSTTSSSSAVTSSSSAARTPGLFVCGGMLPLVLCLLRGGAARSSSVYSLSSSSVADILHESKAVIV